jgi:hypothetical protein
MDAAVEVPILADEIVGANAKVEKQVLDALSLVEFAISSGYVSADGGSVPSEIISTIETTAAKLGFYKQAGLETIGGAEGRIPLAQWTEFQAAYYRLAKALSPITAQTLRDTDPFGSYKDSPSLWYRLGQWLLGASPANRFTRGLWIVAIVFVVFVILSDWFSYYAGLDANQKRAWVAELAQFLQILVPYAYGGLGACAYLLRSAHKFIYKRTFDVLRKPEYFNRILLGMIAGGTIILFVDKAVGDEDTTIQLGSAALGFIAGYSTDFLFNKIQKIIGVLLPKDGDDGDGSGGGGGSSGPSRRPKNPSGESDIGLKELTERHDKADPQDKDFYKALIGHVAGAELASVTRSRSRTRKSSPDATAKDKEKDGDSATKPPE